jgi:hypothetical protein
MATPSRPPFRKLPQSLLRLSTDIIDHGNGPHWCRFDLHPSMKVGGSCDYGGELNAHMPLGRILSRVDESRHLLEFKET